MAHQHSSQPRLSPSSYEEDIRAVLAPRLAYFEAVARHEHVTRAAHELGVPQSTLSRAMVRLEQDLGVALFARKGRTVSLTPAGRTFLGSAERALAEVEKAADSVRADADATARQGRLRLPPHDGLGNRPRPDPRLPRRPPPGPLPARPELRRSHDRTPPRGRPRPLPHLTCPGRPRPGGPPPGRTAPAPGRPRGPPPGHPPPHPPGGGRRRNLRHPGTRLRPAPHHGRPLHGGRLRPARRVRGRGGGDPARPGRGRAWAWRCSRLRRWPARGSWN